MVKQLMCSVFGHRVKRRRVRRHGETYVGRCKWCRKRMEKNGEGWQLQHRHAA